ncbi:hypothetical protein D3C78_889530 [compost metagenome]
MLDALGGGRQGRVEPRGFHPGGEFSLQLLPDRRLHVATLAVQALHEHPQRTAMGRELTDVEHLQAIALAQGLHSGQREVGIMLVVQRVELLAGHQRQQLRKFESRHAGRLEQGRETAEEIVDIRDVGQHVVGGHQVGAPALALQLRGAVATEKQLADLQAFFPRCLRGAASGLDTQARDAALGHVLQQVTVVGRDFHHAAVGGQAEAFDHLGHITLGMGQPGAGERTEIGVLGIEQAVGAGVILGLHQPALLAHGNLQRHPLFGLLQLIGTHVSVGRRRGAQVNQRQGQRSGATTAVHRRTPAKCSSSAGWLASRTDRLLTGNGQAIASRGSSTDNPPSCSGV